MPGRPKSTFTSVLPLQDLRQPRYSRLLSNDFEEDDNDSKTLSSFDVAIDMLNSRGIWRGLLVLAVLLLIANLIHPVMRRTAKHGSADGETSDSTSSGDLLCPHEVDWTQYAYFQFATNETELCSSLVLFQALRRLKTEADLVLVYPDSWVPGDLGIIDEMLETARELGVRTAPAAPLDLGADWSSSGNFGVLMAFNQTRYKRVLSLNSNGLILQNMDELFLLPSAPLASPRMYWLTDQPTTTLSPDLMLLEPSEYEFQRIGQVAQDQNDTSYSAIISDLYGMRSLVLPQRRYLLPTSELANADHSHYLGSAKEDWNVKAIVNETKYVLLSSTIEAQSWGDSAPGCKGLAEKEDCSNRDMWLWVYREVERPRQEVCGATF